MKINFGKLATAGAMMILMAAVVWAQYGAGPCGQRVDTSNPVVVHGQVEKYAAGYGQGTPTLVVRDSSGKRYSFVLGPYRYLASKKFVAKTGDQVEVHAWASNLCPSGYAVEEVRNVTRGVTVKLRDANGRPLWTGGGSPGPRGPSMAGGGGWARSGAGNCAGAGPDMSAVTTIEGRVRSFSGGFGQGMPTLVLETAQGEQEIIVSPYHVLADADFDITEGMELEVTMAPARWDAGEHWVALKLVDPATGLEVELRDAASGFPAGGRGRR
ncbi:MAG: hypothetical protein AB1714_19735 [Acidobacteriota bacterium]